MTTRNSSIKLSLTSGAFASEMRALTGKVGVAGRQMGMSLSRPLSAGFRAVKQQLAGITSSMKNTIKTYGTLAGTVATGLLTKDAIELQGIYRTLAFDVEKLNAGMGDWKDVQRDVDKAAVDTGQRAKEMAAAYQEVYRATGDLEYTKKTLEAIGMAATASGEDTANYATAAQMMMRKFNLTAEQVPDAMAMITQQANSGAIGLDGLNARFGMLAGEAKMAGMTGVEGMTDLLGLFRLLDSEMGEKLTPALTTMFQYMKAGTTYAKEFKKAGVDFEPDMSFLDKFKQMLKGKGRIVAEEKFTGFARNAFDLLAKPFDDALKDAEKKGMRKAEQVDYAMKKLDKAFSAASDTTWKYSDLQRMAADRMRDDPSVKLRIAIGKLESAMSQPKMIGAIEKLTNSLPILADKMADLINWVVENPWKAGGVLAGAKLGGPAVSAMFGVGLGGALKSIATKAFGIGTTAAATAAVTTTAAATAAAGTTTAAATTAGSTITAAAVTANATLIAGAGALGGVIGHIINKTQVEPELKKMSERRRDISDLTTDVWSMTSSKKKDWRDEFAAMDLLREVRKAKKETEPSRLEKFINLAVGSFGGDWEKTALEAQQRDRLQKLELIKAEKDLLNMIKRLTNEGDGAADSLKKVNKAAATPVSIPGKEQSKTARGVRKPANSVPGAIGVEG